MEIKVVCPCGTKFKFDVEPVQDRMPAPINCPTCGADSTPQANIAIASSLQSAPAPVPVAIPLSSPPAPSGLRINRPPPEAQSPGEQPAPVSAHLPPPLASRPSAAKKKQLRQVLVTVGTILVVAFGLWRFGYRWYRRIKLVAAVATAAGEASAHAANGDASGPVNLWYDNAAVLFIKHTNHLQVAQACQSYWATNLHKNLVLLNSSKDEIEPDEFQLIPALNGYVRIVGGFQQWPVARQEALAKYLSQTLGTLTFEWRTESFADTYHFGVYDQGERKFHAQMDIKGTADDPREVVTTDGNDFAIANGYKPGPEGFKNFHVLEADKITLHLGMNLENEKEYSGTNAMLLLKETGASTAKKL